MTTKPHFRETVSLQCHASEGKTHFIRGHATESHDKDLFVFINSATWFISIAHVGALSGFFLPLSLSGGLVRSGNASMSSQAHQQNLGSGPSELWASQSGRKEDAYCFFFTLSNTVREWQTTLQTLKHWESWCVAQGFNVRKIMYISSLLRKLNVRVCRKAYKILIFNPKSLLVLVYNFV